MPSILGLEFPPISHVVEWPIIFGGDWLGVNKVVLLMWASVIVVFAFFMLAARRQRARAHRRPERRRVDRRLRPERHHPADDGPGRAGLHALLPDAVHLHLRLQHLGDHPGRADAGERPHRPAGVHGAARVRHLPRRRHQAAGALGYLKSSLIPPGVPKAHPAAARPSSWSRSSSRQPLSLASDSSPTCSPATCCSSPSPSSAAALWAVQWQIVILPFSGFLLVALTGFEVLVAFLQAYIFTILAAVYIGQSMHPEH